MPKVEAYRATVCVTGSMTVDFEQVEFYNMSEDVYAESYGVLFDRLVQASMRISAETSKWMKKHHPGPKPFKSDGAHWMVSVSYPDAFGVGSGDVGGGSAFDSAKDIILDVAHYRHMALGGVLRNLSNARADENLRVYPTNLDNSWTEVYSLRSYANILDYGIPSAWVDEKLAEAEEDGTADRWRRSLVASRAVFDRNAKTRARMNAAKNTTKKKHWWSWS